jgi:amino acid permease
MCVSVGAILLNLVFILKKEIGVLQKVAVIGVISVIINVGIIAITFFLTGFSVEVLIDKVEVVIDYDGISGVDWGSLEWAHLDGWTAFSQQVQGLASIIFCYVNHQLVFPLVFDLTNPSKRRLSKVFNRVHVTEIVAYSLVGMCGYLLLGPHADVRPINALVMASIPTTSMSIGKCLMVFSLFFAVPLNLFPARTVIYETFALEKNNRNHVALSLGLAFSGTAIAIFFQQVNSYFGLLGGTAGVMMAGAIPMVCYKKLLGINSVKEKLMAAFMVLVSLLGILGAFLSVVDTQSN